MKRAVPYIIAGVVVIVVAAYLVFFLGVTAKQGRELCCGGVRIAVADSVNMKFITADDVAYCIRHEYCECKGMPVGKIDLERIENILQAKNAVLSAEAYITTNGMLNVEVIQRIPALRLKNDEEDFYVDGDGYVFHLQAVGAAKIMTVGGHFPVRVEEDFQGVPADEKDAEWINGMLTLTDYLTEAGMGEGVGIYVCENGDIVLTPAEGHPQFILGRPEDFGSKFARIGEYYSAIVPKEGEDTYSTVSLKYSGQIVCRK